ncbi:MAG: hypothetical protein II565_02660 [Fibrobacter sp.]|jgi:hypothetical protein|nr:hypothetical protein [Fibrobacter sp.]MBQ5463674.1 hypothetical protein [Fibrobacter sp.]
MAELKSGVVLNEDETLVMELEAELWATSSNPMARMVGNVQKFIAKIFGTRIKGYLVVTDKRVIEVTDTVNCYCFNVGRHVKYVLPGSIKEIGYEKSATCGCFCPAYHLYYEGFTQVTSVLLTCASDEEAQKVVDTFYKAVFANQT